MAKEPVSKVTSEQSTPLTLNEFCIRLSVEDKRVELIGGFEHTERVAGRLSDTYENYSERYKKFTTQAA